MGLGCRVSFRVRVASQLIGVQPFNRRPVGRAGLDGILRR